MLSTFTYRILLLTILICGIISKQINTGDNDNKFLDSLNSLISSNCRGKKVNYSVFKDVIIYMKNIYHLANVFLGRTH
jgi:hypothetical protein